MRKVSVHVGVFPETALLAVALLLAAASVLSAGSPDQALLRASLIGNSRGVENALGRGADIESVTDKGWTALMRAANQGHVDTVRLLLERGANVHAGCESGTALTFAVWYGHAPVVELLLEAGARRQPRSSGMIPPIIDAACFGYCDIVELLLDHGADPDTRDSIAGYGGGNKSIEAEKYIEVALTEEEARALAASSDAQVPDRGIRLLAEPVSFPATGARNHIGGATAMTWAAQNGHTAVVRVLLKRGADPDLKGGYCNYPLYVAATGNHPGTVRLLLESGANPDTMGKWPQGTALMRAAQLGRVEIVRLLLDFGAEAGLRDCRGNTALSFARENNRTDVIELLKRAAAQRGSSTTR